MSNQPFRPNATRSSMTFESSANAVLKNTYALLAMTLMFSAICAYIAVAMNFRPINPWVFLAGAIGLQFLISFTANSAMGIASTFLFTGFMGMTAGPILNMYMVTLVNGSELIMIALGGTAMIFFGLSGYILTTKKDMSFLSGAIVTGSIVVLVAMLVALFFQIPALHLAVCVMFMVLSSAVIMYQTSAIVNGGETNYILATVSLYLSIYNLFMTLLQLLIAFSGDNR